MLWDTVMRVIGCVTLTLISIAEVENTWQAVCLTERPLQNYSSLKRPIKYTDKYVVALSYKKETINSKNKQ